MTVMEPISQYVAIEWPQGEEIWFIQDELPQHNQFCTSEQEIMSIELTFSAVEDSLQIMHSSFEHVSSSITQQSNEIILLLEQSLAKQKTLLKQNQLFTDEIAKQQCTTDFYSESSQNNTIIFQLKSITTSLKYSFQSNIRPLVSIGIILITILFVSILFGYLGSCLSFYDDKHTPQFGNNVLLPGINYFGWFRTLAVP
ncbi:unnamed protein product [Rotaria socialis]|uniref:Uncharacterized protein n=2 Tax=Rotaria socialis TaxID=392032 RepID=A0A821KWR3_9BILA|nr:unnamed protein product [Rotaria socialis]